MRTWTVFVLLNLIADFGNVNAQRRLKTTPALLLANQIADRYVSQATAQNFKVEAQQVIKSGSVNEDLKSDLRRANITAVFPGDANYDEVTKSYNLRFKVRPATVTFPFDTQQVAEVVTIGAKHRKPVVARSGGHSYIANGVGGRDGAVVVDLSKLKQIKVYSDGTATIQTGNRLGDVASKLNDAGLALPHGVCPYVGIGGHAAYGGFGLTSRMWGLNLDPVKSIEVVLANGTVANISSKHESDLFWAMKGAGGSFGIATRLTVQTFSTPYSTTVFNYTWGLDPATAAKVVSEFQQFSKSNIPKEFGPRFIVSKGRYDGEVTLKLYGGWYGAAMDFEAVIAPYLAKVPPPFRIKIDIGSYIDSVVQFGEKGTLDTSTPDTNDTYYVKSLMTPEANPIPQKALQAFMEYSAHKGFQTDLEWVVWFELSGGTNSVINSVPMDETAFVHRSSLWTCRFYAAAPKHQPPFPDYGFIFLDDMVTSITANPPPTGWDIGAFPNFSDDRLEDYQQQYYGAHYPRLLFLKKFYDSQNVFSFPQGIGS